MDGPVLPEHPELDIERSIARQGALDRPLERLAVVLVDHREVGREVGRRRGRFHAVLAKDRFRPGQRPAADVPLPEPGPGRGEHDLEARIAGLDLLGEDRHLVEGGCEAISSGAPSGDEDHRRSRGDEVERQPYLFDWIGEERDAGRALGDHGIEHARDDRGRQTADEAGEPGGDDGTGHEEDVAHLSATGLAQRDFERDRAPRDERARHDGRHPTEPDVLRALELALGSPRNARGLQRRVVRQRTSLVVAMLPDHPSGSMDHGTGRPARPAVGGRRAVMPLIRARGTRVRCPCGRRALRCGTPGSHGRIDRRSTDMAREHDDLTPSLHHDDPADDARRRVATIEPDGTAPENEEAGAEALGAGAGALGGAAVGMAVGGPVGAVIGGAVGAVGGAVVGRGRRRR